MFDLSKCWEGSAEKTNKGVQGQKVKNYKNERHFFNLLRLFVFFYICNNRSTGLKNLLRLFFVFCL